MILPLVYAPPTDFVQPARTTECREGWSHRAQERPRILDQRDPSRGGMLATMLPTLSDGCVFHTQNVDDNIRVAALSVCHMVKTHSGSYSQEREVSVAFMNGASPVPAIGLDFRALGPGIPLNPIKSAERR